ncbi:hypothetical protein HK096_003102 [Nowakowskiella sp. JEL0078]|nr:hypothetical protein HK096_003102 [Nowakowskiella sp. JEL0078]
MGGTFLCDTLHKKGTMSKWIGVPAPKSLLIQIVTESNTHPINNKSTDASSDNYRGSPSAGSPLTSVSHFVGQPIVICGRIQILNVHHLRSSIGFLGLELDFSGTLNLSKIKSSAIKETASSLNDNNTKILIHQKLVLKDPACDEETFVSPFEPTYVPFEFNIDTEIAKKILPSINARVAKADGGSSANVHLLSVEYNLHLKMVGIKRGKDSLEIKFPIVMEYCNRPDNKYLNDERSMFKRSIAEDMHQAIRWWTVLPSCLFPDCGAELRYQFYDLLDRHCTSSKRVKEMEFTLYECTIFGSKSNGSLVCKDKRFTWTLSAEAVQNEGWGKSARGTATVPPLSGSFTPSNYLKIDRGINPSGIWSDLSIYHEMVISLTLSTGSNTSNKSISGKIPIHISGVSRQAYLETSWANLVQSAENYHISPPMWAWETDKAMRDSDRQLIPLPQNPYQESYKQKYVSDELVRHVLSNVTNEDHLPVPVIKPQISHLPPLQTKFKDPQTSDISSYSPVHSVSISEKQHNQPRNTVSLPRNPNLVTNSQNNNFIGKSSFQQSFSFSQQQQQQNVAQVRELPVTSFNPSFTFPEQSQGISSFPNIQSSNSPRNNGISNIDTVFPKEIVDEMRQLTSYQQGPAPPNCQRIKYQATNDDLFWYDMMENVHRQPISNPLVNLTTEIMKNTHITRSKTEQYDSMKNGQCISYTQVEPPYMHFQYPQRSVTITPPQQQQSCNVNVRTSAIDDWKYESSTSTASEQRKLGLSDEELVELAIKESLVSTKQISTLVATPIQETDSLLVIPSSDTMSSVDILKQRLNTDHGNYITSDIVVMQASGHTSGLSIRKVSETSPNYDTPPISLNTYSNSYLSEVSAEQRCLGLSEQELIDLAIKESLSINYSKTLVIETNSEAGPSRIYPTRSLSYDRERVSSHLAINIRSKSAGPATSIQRGRPHVIANDIIITKSAEVLEVLNNGLIKSPGTEKRFMLPSDVVDAPVIAEDANLSPKSVLNDKKISEFLELDPPELPKIKNMDQSKFGVNETTHSYSNIKPPELPKRKNTTQTVVNIPPELPKRNVPLGVPPLPPKNAITT